MLNDHVEEWTHLFYMYGEGISADHAKTMFMRLLPDSIRTEVYRRPDVERLQLFELADWVKHQTLWERSEELMAQHLKPEKVTSLGRQDPGPSPGDDAQHAAALPPGTGGPPRRPPGKGAGRGKGAGKGTNRPDPLAKEFPANTCYHCGQSGHSRTANNKLGTKGCPAFEAYKKAKGDKWRDGYEGALEKSFEKRKLPKVSTLLSPSTQIHRASKAKLLLSTQKASSAKMLWMTWMTPHSLARSLVEPLC